MKRFLLSHGLIAAAAIYATVPAIAPSYYPAMPVWEQSDPRLDELLHFLKVNECPSVAFAQDFLAEADAHNLDWRLLPSISLIESGGGREARNNNIFGWDSGKASFPSVREGIRFVADQLSNSELYRDKDVDGILHTYNPTPGYAARVKTVMARLSPAESLE
jgi:hypothetical protein